MLKQEPLDVREAPGRAMGKVAELWKPTESGRIVCTACARYCKIGEGQVGLCGIRGVHEGKLWLYTYGKVITGHVDPIEKKPVTHYRPGSKIFSIATTGCNWLCRYCFLPGTMVLTDQGHQPIEQVFRAASETDNPEVRIPVDREAFTHRGRWRRVTQVFEHLYAGSVLRIRPYYLPAFESTPNHRVFASIGGAPVKKIRADHLKVGDFLAIPRPEGRAVGAIYVSSLLRGRPGPPYARHHRLEVAKGKVRWTSERGPGLPARLRVTSSLARLLGYYCAEGSVSWHNKRPNSGSVWFSFGAHEEGRIREVERLLRGTFSVKTRRVRQDNRIAVIASGASLAAVFQELCGDSSGTKRVPEVILRTTNRAVLRSFLAGYFNGDGYLTQSSAGLILGSSSVSPALSYGVAQVLFSLDQVPKVYHASNPSSYEIEGRTVSRANDIMLRLRVDEARMEPQSVSWKASPVRVLKTKEHFLLPIREITEREYVGPVYNLEVEEDHSYTANFTAVSNCQNFDISQRRKIEGIDAQPEDIVRMTVEQGCQGLAYTYNQPTIFIEYARDVGMLARKAGLINIFVSNGYDTPEAVAEMRPFLDCITVDFKGSGETNFVRKYISIPNADPIFSTLKELRDTTKIHTEITDLIIPQVGDDLDAARKLSKFVYDELGPDTPIHFLRFHPDYKMMDLPWTPVETLEKHCEVAKAEGLRYVYMGNVPGHPWEHTYCPECGAIAIRRNGFDITGWNLGKDNRCKACDYKLPIYGSLEKTVKEERYYGVLWHP